MNRDNVSIWISLLGLAAFASWCFGGPEPVSKPHLAPTPPMGWNSWEAFRKDFDEDSLKAQADAMVQLGFRDAGYVYLVIDGGWKASQRDGAGDLVPDPKKFPHGIKALADYVHSRGLKFGLHQPAGVKDCGHDEPGSQGNEERDAVMFASWGVDYIKYDQCDYIHDANRTPGAPDLDKLTVRQGDQVIVATEAEDTRNRLKGMARIEDCERCSGKKSVAGIGLADGGVEMQTRVADAGPYTLEIQFAKPYYGQNRDRFKQMTLFVSVNGGARQRMDIPYDVADRYATGTVSTGIELKQGNNAILLDNPSSQEEDVRVSYLKMGGALARSGRPIMFSTSGAPRPWLWAEPVAHLFRTAGDISNRWTSIMTTIDRHAGVAHFGHPNFWADPDMLEVGAPAPAARKGQSSVATTMTEQRTQFALWAIMNAPLFISADLRHLNVEAKAILLNREIIAVDQDTLSAPGRIIRSDGDVQVFAKRLKDGEAVALFNRGASPVKIRVTAGELGLDGSALEIHDLGTSQSERVTDGVVSATVASHGVKMFRVHASGVKSR